MPVNIAPGGLSQEEYLEFENSLDYIARPWLKKKREKNNNKDWKGYGEI